MNLFRNSSSRGFDLELHFHGLKNNHRILWSHFAVSFHKDLDDLSWDWRVNMIGIVTATCSALPNPTVPDVV